MCVCVCVCVCATKCTCASPTPQQLYSAVKRLEMERDLDYWKELQGQGGFQRQTVPCTDMTVSLSHLTNKKLNDNMTRFICKGRLQLLETNSVIHTYFPDNPSSCPLCGFHTDSNSHALNGCRELKGLYTDRHDRVVGLVGDVLEKNIVTDYCDVLCDQRVQFDGFTSVGIANNRPDITIIDHANSVAFIVEVAVPYDSFIDTCYQHKFDKYMPLCLALNNVGFHTKIIVLIIGSLGHVHKRFVSGLQTLGISRQASRSLARYVATSVMIGSRRVWERRRFRVGVV